MGGWVGGWEKRQATPNSCQKGVVILVSILTRLLTPNIFRKFEPAKKEKIKVYRLARKKQSPLAALSENCKAISNIQIIGKKRERPWHFVYTSHKTFKVPQNKLIKRRQRSI